MSYILDALRKSEQERQRGRVPDLSSYQNTPADEQPRTNIWPWIAGVAVVVNLVVVLVIWTPWRSQPIAGSTTGVAVTPNAVTPPAPVAKSAAGNSNPQTPETTATPPAPAPIAAPKPDVAKAAQPAIPTTVVDATRKPLAQPLVIHPESDTASNAQEQEPPPPNVAYMPQLDELPPAQRKDVPDMTFSSHMYSSIPRFRSVIINGKRLKEGDYFTPKIQLREITDTGVIMSDGTTLFSVDVLGRWAQ